jgi:hypothetical protein
VGAVAVTFADRRSLTLPDTIGWMSDVAAGGATVAVAGKRHGLGPGQALTFGRAESCDVCLDPDDVGISRLAGSVEYVDGVWFVTNRSTGRPVSAVDPLGFRTVLAPGRRMAVDERLSIIVEGQVRRHELVVTAPRAPTASVVSPPDAEGLPTEMGGGVSYTDDDRRALAALFAGYLRPFPRYDPRPRSYADAAAVLGWPRTTLVKRVEYIRTRLVRAGVPNLQGDRALEALAEHVIAGGVIGRDDLERLGEG